MDIANFKKLPVMGILRGIDAQVIEPLVEAAVEGGLQTIEITMNTPGAPDLIRRMVKASEGRLTIGAGTVLTKEDLTSALDAGATFIVSPVLVPDVTQYCVQRSIPVFPGALTPKEIYEAWNAGATMVKVFPSKFFGPEYLSEIKGPFPQIELLACGGVTSQNIKMFFAHGASAVAFGASVFRKEWLQGREFFTIKKHLQELIGSR